MNSWILIVPFEVVEPGLKPACSIFSSIIPTQQQLQEIYEENLRQRESAKFTSESSAAESTAAKARTQFLEDERIALMLQNEEFMSELRRDHEFMSALEMEQQVSGFCQN